MKAKVKIIDFGIAQSALRTRSSNLASALASSDTLAPEQLIRGGVIDRRTDIYAAGVVLYELLTGAAVSVSRRNGLPADVPSVTIETICNRRRAMPGWMRRWTPFWPKRWRCGRKTVTRWRKSSATPPAQAVAAQSDDFGGPAGESDGRAVCYRTPDGNRRAGADASGRFLGIQRRNGRRRRTHRDVCARAGRRPARQWQRPR